MLSLEIDNMRFQRLLPSLALAFFLLVCCGCVKNIYVAPNAVVEDPPAKAAPMTMGLLIPQSVRDAWYPRTTSRKMSRKRVDVPVGNLALDYARTGMTPAFKDFYILRYKDRRSEKGFLATIEQISYDLEGEKVTLKASITIEDEQKKETFKKDYVVTSDAAKSGLRIPFLSQSPEAALEDNTAAVYISFYKQLVGDIYALTGFVKPPVETKPQPAKADDTVAPPAPTGDVAPPVDIDKTPEPAPTGDVAPPVDIDKTPEPAPTGDTQPSVDLPVE